MTVPQFRALVFLDRNSGESLSVLAEHLGLSVAATSRLAEGLVKKNLLARDISTTNRRMVALSPSAKGREAVRSAQRTAEARLADVVAALSVRELNAIRDSLRILREKVEVALTEKVSPRSPPSRSKSLKRRKSPIR
jgi:DNA-binding MarR family transcriptional regulator